MGIGFYVLVCEHVKPRRILVDDKLLVGKSKFVTGIDRGTECYLFCIFPFYFNLLVSASFAFKKSDNPYVIIPTTFAPNCEMNFSVNLSMNTSQ